MDWFNRLCYERDRKVAEKDAIQRSLDTYWASLLSMIEAGQTSFAARYPAAGYTTSYAAATATTDPTLRRTEGGVNHDVTLRKHTTPPRLTANYSDPIPAVILEVVPDGGGCPVLRMNDQPITIDGACEKIVRPILFP